ncbi:phaC PHA synthase [Psychromonas sp. psych-6C06]|uniref:VC2662 family protein n=1 Tax=Psychromonas sp. psych-6C06 TaxID=2058089 RepID=UPI000C33DE55|nr:phaC PHA synthase [Psychromonas sp. psych-6C06]PKF62456.1 phaC PHA synthase [Psychromonas sp. psych-6C06]
MKKLLIASTLLASTAAFAEEAPVMFSTIDFNAPAAESVKGARLTVLHGKVDELTGVDFALLGMSETNKTTGVNLGIWGAAKVNQDMTGASLGLFNWIPGQTTGLNLGTVNITGDVKGANLGFVNYSEGNTVFDWAAVSVSDSSTVQLGFVNVTKEIRGVQIGILNCADNGFFKCFPIVNFAK